jgi:hypothetical protein
MTGNGRIILKYIIEKCVAKKCTGIRKHSMPFFCVQGDQFSGSVTESIALFT